jgi:hypothetical protein
LVLLDAMAGTEAAVVSVVWTHSQLQVTIRFM